MSMIWSIGESDDVLHCLKNMCKDINRKMSICSVICIVKRTYQNKGNALLFETVLQFDLIITQKNI